MTRRLRKKRGAPAPAPLPARLPRGALLALGAVILLLVVGGWRMWGRDAAVPASTTPAAASNQGFAALKGRWQRVDGGYLLDIGDVAASGAIEAAYFNPRPIRVARATASLAGGVARVFVELRDVNYPGSTYELTYDAAHDQLRGTYFQAALDQTFDVSFQRLARR
jgi:hypothetical protein